MKNPQLEHLLAALNPEQLRAVREGDGPVLVLAGAGSGKTRVLTTRVAYILARKLALPDSIMAVTFTNKAANEMRERLARQVGMDFTTGWIGTFHSIGARILRREGRHLNLDRSFNIYDAMDQLSCIKLILEEKKIPQETIQPKAVLWSISNAKSAFLSPEQMLSQAESEFDRYSAMVYQRYIAMLQENNAVDFDDLLRLPVLLFEEKAAVAEVYQRKFKYVLVDEYQDTNRAQYLLIKRLAAISQNLFAVGDDDQSIYRWRGADLRNILEFSHDFPACKIFRLEQNYRSTKNILDAAHSVVVHNKGRHDKKLWTERERGEKIQILEAGDETQEAEFIVEMIEQEISRHPRNFRDFALLYRTNAQSRVLEDSLRRHAVPYTIVGGLRFYERKEVKDVLAYMRLVANPVDTISLLRVINYPLRGIGDATIARLQKFALQEGVLLFDALARAGEIDGIGERLQNVIAGFHGFIRKYISLNGKISLTELVNSLVEETAILQNYKREGTPDSQTRMENIRELLQAVFDYSRATPDATLDGFLEQVSLVSDIDTWDDRGNAVTLMTLHSAKGLEFPVVFLCGLEEGLFPLSRSMESQDDLEEERRLFYVGATRAKESLYISFARFRNRFGERSQCLKSRFLKELDPQLLEFHSSTRATPARAFRRRAALEETAQVMPTYEDFSQEEFALQPGMRVRHARFGDGEILIVQGRGASTKVIVNFETVGRKTLMVQYANLQIL